MKKVTVKFNFSSIIWGIILVAAGVIFALNSLEITNVDIFFKGWWTLFIIIPCTVSLVTDRHLENVTGNLFGIAIGVFLLLCARGILDYSVLWKLLLPAFIVILGLKLLFSGLFGRKHRDDAFDAIFDDNDEDEEDDEGEEGNNDHELHRSSAIFSTHRINYDGMKFEYAELNVVFGSAQLDLRNAIIEGDCKVYADCVFGGITILVPENVNVKVRGNGIFGGVTDKTTTCENAPTIYVKSNFAFGGISIK